MFLFVRFRSLRLPVSSAAPAPRRTDCQDGVSPAGANRPGGMCGMLCAVCVDEDALGRASRLDQGEAAWRNAVLEQLLSFAEHQRKDPDAIFVDEFDGDQRLQQFTAAPDMHAGPSDAFSRRTSSTTSPPMCSEFSQSNWSRLRVTTYFVALLNAFAIGLSPWFGQ